MLWKAQYSKLGSKKALDDDNQEPRQQPWTSVGQRWAGFCLGIVTGFLFVITVSLVIHGVRTRNSSDVMAYPVSTKTKLCNCGDSAEEALSNGCKFDPYSLTWLPEHCWDEELMQLFEDIKFHQQHDFTIYSWTKPPVPISMEEAGQLAGNPWNITNNRVKTSQNWHYAHCIYIFLKHFRSKTTHLGMAARYLTQGHAEHCAKAVMGLIVRDPDAHKATSVSAVYVFNDNEDEV